MTKIQQAAGGRFFFCVFDPHMYVCVHFCHGLVFFGGKKPGQSVGGGFWVNKCMAFQKQRGEREGNSSVCDFPEGRRKVFPLCAWLCYRIHLGGADYAA